MQETITWHKLEQRLKSIRDPHLRADVSYVHGSGQSGWWVLVNGLSESTKTSFRANAEIAGELLNPGSGDPFTVWLDALQNFCIRSRSKKLSPLLKAVNEDGTSDGQPRFRTIEQVCEASADFCCWLEAKSVKDSSTGPKSRVAPGSANPPPSGPGETSAGDTEGKQETGVPKYHPARDEFLKLHMAKRHRRRNGIAVGANITPSSLQRWHEGKSRLSDSSVLKLAQYLNVTVASIPND